jgi:protein arginine N-methyltransferase 1
LPHEPFGASVVRLRGGGLCGKADGGDVEGCGAGNREERSGEEEKGDEVQVLYRSGGEGEESKGEEAKEDEDEYYFNSYAHFGIHEEMLKDDQRTCAYRDSLLKNAHLLKGKTVLDIGCGTGILSLFAAQAGAKHVFAVDMSDIADTARQIVHVNGMSHVITVIKGNIEQLELPVDKVDVIVSEWMGYCLLYEAMFDSVMLARDKWLKPGGMLLPDKAAVYITAIEDEKYKNEKIHFWDNVYGFNMSCVKGAAMFEPLVDTVDRNQICTTTQCIWEVDLLTVTKAGLEIEAPFSLAATRNDYCHALVLWFDVGFTQVGCRV